jgi:hypothetical protein
MKAPRLLVLIALMGLVGCGREGPLVSSALTSPSPTTVATPIATPTPEATESPAATESPTPSPDSDESPAPTGGGSDNSGIQGSVRAGPTCPVEQENSPCPDRPVAGAEVTAKTASGEEAGKTTADEEGRFSLRLEPGSYDVTASSPSVMGCDTQRVDVIESHYTPVRITCDTGIR